VNAEGRPRSISKSRVDRLGERLRHGEVQEADLLELDEFRRSFSASYARVVSVVARITGVAPSGRPAKSTTAIVEKLRRETIRLSQMQDIAGCRLVVPSVHDQDALVGQLRAAFVRATVVDRRESPSHGYRAVHVIVEDGERPVEIQVRTSFQHLWAEFSEKLSDVIDPSIKYGGGNKITRTSLRASSEAIRQMEGLEYDLVPMRQARSEGKLSVESLAALDGYEAMLVQTTRSLRKSMEETMRIVEDFAGGGDDDLPS
jgi:ppGpp synthetase/RelA/SpoT-type nucleotidyltranferase